MSGENMFLETIMSAQNNFAVGAGSGNLLFLLLTPILLLLPVHLVRRSYSVVLDLLQRLGLRIVFVIYK